MCTTYEIWTRFVDSHCKQINHVEGDAQMCTTYEIWTPLFHTANKSIAFKLRAMHKCALLMKYELDSLIHIANKSITLMPIRTVNWLWTRDCLFTQWIHDIDTIPYSDRIHYIVPWPHDCPFVPWSHDCLSGQWIHYIDTIAYPDRIHYIVPWSHDCPFVPWSHDCLSGQWIHYIDTIAHPDSEFITLTQLPIRTVNSLHRCLVTRLPIRTVNSLPRCLVTRLPIRTVNSLHWHNCLSGQWIHYIVAWSHDCLSGQWIHYILPWLHDCLSGQWIQYIVPWSHDCLSG
jgi:hypothetical protein